MSEYIEPVLPFKIYDYLVRDNWGHVDRFAWPGNIDYKKDLTCRLQRKESWSHGFLIKVEYYYEYDPELNVYSVPVLDVEQEYVYGTDGFINYRDKDWYYYDVDENRHWVKGGIEYRKYYTTSIEKRREGLRRRENVMYNTEMTTIWLLMNTAGMEVSEAEAQGKLMLGQYATERQYYLENDTDHLVQAIQADTNFAWLDNVIDGQGNTIRIYMISELSYHPENELLSQTGE